MNKKTPNPLQLTEKIFSGLDALQKYFSLHYSPVSIPTEEISL